MNRRIIFLAILSAILWAAPATAGDFDWKKELNRDLVTVENGKMKFSEYEVCTRKDKKKLALQFHWTAEAPAKGLISRDQFVSNVTGFNVAFLGEMMAQAGMSLSDFFDKVTCKPVDKPIGKVDIKLHLQFAEGGLQIQFSAPGKKESRQATLTWEQVFDDL